MRDSSSDSDVSDEPVRGSSTSDPSREVQNQQKRDSEIEDATGEREEVRQAESRDTSKVAAGLSAIGLVIPFLAGMGQVYKGQVAKGVILGIIQMFNLVLVAFLIGFVTYPLVGLYAIYDAYRPS